MHLYFDLTLCSRAQSFSESYYRPIIPATHPAFHLLSSAFDCGLRASCGDLTGAAVQCSCQYLDDKNRAPSLAA
jgi:hypothetical protein